MGAVYLAEQIAGCSNAGCGRLAISQISGRLWVLYPGDNNHMKSSMTCVQCGKSVMDLSVRFCPQCGQPLFIDLSRSDLTRVAFLDVLNSLHNLITTADFKAPDEYFHPVSRRLINRRYELEHRLEFGTSMFDFFGEASFPDRIETINMRIHARSSNTVTGYAVRAAEELVVKKKTPPLPVKEIEAGIQSFANQYADNYLVKDISINMSDEMQRRRILFICKRTVLAVWTGLISVGILPSGHSGCVHLEVRWMLRIPQ
jgi:predicted RNA-binding Zn-ribbon protein involved in translation (DUF1610 family)